MSEIAGVMAVATLSLAMAVYSSCHTTAAESASGVHARASAVPVTTAHSHASPMPDFSAYQNIGQRKHAFYQFLLPRIREANAEVMRQREWLLGVAAKLIGGRSLTTMELTGVLALEHHYSLDPKGDIVQQVGKLLRRVDTVPASLVLAQAAKESGWGTSRFAVEGKNFFGIWCFSQGCGIRPEHRDAGHIHEVATFNTVASGVRYYIRMLNSRPAYKQLRQIRARARRQHQLAPGDELAQGLTRYSARGVAYVKEIQSIIHSNNLHRFTIDHQEA